MTATPQGILLSWYWECLWLSFSMTLEDFMSKCGFCNAPVIS